MTTIRWMLALALAAFFAFVGVQKFGAENAVFALIAERSNIPAFDPFIRMLTGGAELLTAILLAIPQSRTAGAKLGLVILISAIGFHFSPWLGIDIPGIGTSLFMMAIGGLVLAVIVYLLERNRPAMKPQA